MIPFMALRLGPGKEDGGRKLSVLDKAVGESQWGIGAVGGAMGAVSLMWMAVGRGGDFGSIADVSPPRRRLARGGARGLHFLRPPP